MRIRTAVGLSILVHAVVLLICLLIAPDTPPARKDVTVVELLEEPELPTRPKQNPADMKDFVRSAPAPRDLLTEEKKQKRFSS
ncbi:MAG TPA: hypothetical protein VM432_07985, partial [Bdellovibrionales bacterium]|nr:hypothetical protein [Bdellovibrionales bacterium]